MAAVKIEAQQTEGPVFEDRDGTIPTPLMSVENPAASSENKSADIEQQALTVEQTYLRDMSRIDMPTEHEADDLATRLEENRKILRLRVFETAPAAEEALELLRAVVRKDRSFDRVLKLEGRIARVTKRKLPLIVSRVERLLEARRMIARSTRESGTPQSRLQAMEASTALREAMIPISRILTALKIDMGFVYPMLDRLVRFSDEFRRLDEALQRKIRRRGQGFIDPDAENRWTEAFVSAMQSPHDLVRTVSSIEKIRDRYLNVKSELCTRNLRLVVNMVRRFHNQGMPFLDLVQEGTMGLMSALDKFEIGRGHRLSTYATWWIRQSILRCIANQSRVVRLPLHMSRVLGVVKKARNDVADREGRDPVPEDLAGEIDVPLEDLRVLHAFVRPTASIDRPLRNKEGEGTVSDLLADEGSPSVIETTEELQLRDRIDEVLSRLPRQEREIVEHRFGLHGTTEKTLQQLGEMYDVSRERIRQIETKALARLKSDEIRKDLEGFAPA